MTKTAYHFPAAALIICMLAISACTQQRSPCYDPKIVSVAIGTYRMVDTTSIDTLLPEPAFICLDTNIIQAVSARNSFSALLTPHLDSTRWMLIPNQDGGADSTGTAVEFYDTITFYHTKKLNFISNACGYVYYYTLDNVSTTRHSIDSISIINRSVDNNANTQHLRIYY